MTGQKTAIIEAPFLQPGMPYPETFHWSASLRARGVDAFALDLNVILYRAIIEDRTPIINAHQLVSCVGRAGFMDEQQLLHRIGGTAADAPERLKPLHARALALFSDSGPGVTHAAYVDGVAILNGFLDYRVKQIDSRLSLWLDSILYDVVSGDANSLLTEACRTDSSMQRLFDRYLFHLLELVDFDQAFVAIRCEEQLLPGLTLAHWLRHHLQKRVAVGGHYLETVLALRTPRQIFTVCDSVVLAPLDSSLPSWATDCCDRNFYRSTNESRHEAWLHHGHIAEVTDTSTMGEAPRYFSPIKVAGVLATSRCYWSRCSFCALARESIHPFRHASAQHFAARLRELDLDHEVRHLQFLDYALPPSLLNGAAELCGTLDLRWAAQLRFDRALLRNGCFTELHRLGCRAVSWGLESGSDSVLSMMRKSSGLRAESRAVILRESALAGITNHLFVIVGYPGESVADFLATLEFISRNLDYIHSVEVHAYQPIADTPACQALEADGALVSLGDWSPRRGFRDSRLEAAARHREAVVTEVARSLGRLHRTSDLLEGHMSFQHLWRYGATK